MPPVARLLFDVTGRKRLENHTIFTRIITYKSISKNTSLQFATIYVFQQYFTKSVGPGRFSAENLKVDHGQNDGMTEGRINLGWAG